jgi:hypothetical protein
MMIRTFSGNLFKRKAEKKDYLYSQPFQIGYPSSRLNGNPEAAGQLARPTTVINAIKVTR